MLAIARLRIPDPCSKNWDELDGGENVRYCRFCGKNVYNVSAMTDGEARTLIETITSPICVRGVCDGEGNLMTRRIFTGIAAAAIPLVFASAQDTDDGAISGVVSDAAGAGVPGAEVLLKISGGQDRKATANRSGEYLIEQLKPGKYELEASCPGFVTFRQTGLIIQPGSRTSASIVLQIGKITMGGPVIAAP